MGCVKLEDMAYQSAASSLYRGVTAEQALKEFDGFVRQFARDFKVAGLELEDLEQEARLAVIKAVASHKPGSRSLKNYVCWYIRAALKAFKRQNMKRKHLSLDEELQEEEGLTRHEVLGMEAEQEDTLIQKRKVELQKKIAVNRVAAIKREGEKKDSSSRIQEILELQLQGLSQRAIAAKLGISQPAVCQALSKLKKRPVA